MAISPNVTFVSGAVYTAAQANKFGFGVVALATSTTAAQTPITTVVDLTGMSVTFTAIANRYYRFNYHIYAVPTVTNACFTVNLQQGATIKQISIVNGGLAGVGATCQGLYVSTFTAGSTTLKLTGALTSGSTGSFIFNAAATLPWIFSVEDIGQS